MKKKEKVAKAFRNFILEAASLKIAFVNKNRIINHDTKATSIVLELTQ